MQTTNYPGELTIAEALRLFYTNNGLGEDGGADSKWIQIELGFLSIPFPNPPARKQAVFFHDIHHIIGGFPLTWQGEAAIGAWEIASGCGKYSAAWVFNFGIFALGLFFAPVIIFNNFRRGRRSTNFYRPTLCRNTILSTTVAEAQQNFNLRSPLPPLSIGDVFAFAGWWLIAFVTAFMVFVAPVVFMVHLVVD